MKNGASVNRGAVFCVLTAAALPLACLGQTWVFRHSVAGTMSPRLAHVMPSGQLEGLNMGIQGLAVMFHQLGGFLQLPQYHH